MKELGIDLNSKKSLIDEIVKFNDNHQIHSKRISLFRQNQNYLEDYLDFATNTNPSRNIQDRSTKTIAKYDVNGDRDFMYFNITEYKDHTLNRIGSKEDGKILNRTLKNKKFILKAFRDGQINKKCIVDQLKQYVKEVNDKQRDVKVLIIAFMAHGDQGDRILFSDKSSCKYKYEFNDTSGIIPSLCKLGIIYNKHSLKLSF